MAFDVLSFVLGQKFGEASGGSSDTLILAETNYEGFTLQEGTNYYVAYAVPPPFTLEVGKTYRVIWDGTEYDDCVGQDISAMQAGAVGIGNASFAGGTGKDEPFIIAWTASGVGLYSTENKTSHTVKIYQKVESEEPSGGGGNIVFKYASVTLTGEHGERVSVDFGFVPDFLLLYFSNYAATVPTFAPFVYLGFSEKMAVNGSAIGQWCIKRRDANTFNIDKIIRPIDYQTDYKYTDILYNTDETGFNVGGKGNPAPAGTYTVYAYKFS